MGCRMQDRPSPGERLGESLQAQQDEQAMVNGSIWSSADHYQWVSECHVSVQKFAIVIIYVQKGKLFKLLKQPWPYMGLKCSSEHSK